MYVCVCVCEGVFGGYVCEGVCVCVCMCVYVYAWKDGHACGGGEIT